MAMNPMQRKSRQSFLLGVVVALLIAAVIIALMFLQIKKMKQQIDTNINEKRMAYVLKRDVKSGEKLTADMFEQKEVTKDSVPSDVANVTGENIIAKIDLKANTVISASMVTE